jgi:hypothetical protein
MTSAQRIDKSSFYGLVNQSNEIDSDIDLKKLKIATIYIWSLKNNDFAVYSMLSDF